jgi:hypothetical protein
LLQIVPALRQRWPAFHRWNGRIYLLVACTMSLGGIAMTVTRGTIGAPIQTVAILLNAALILIFAVVALHYAMARRIDVHRRWALRLFLVVSGVWFLRVMMMGWVMVNRGPVGFDMETFSGPFLTFASFGQYLLPLAILELYFRAQANGGRRLRYVAASVVALATAATATGILAATMMMWLPRL